MSLKVLLGISLALIASGLLLVLSVQFSWPGSHELDGLDFRIENSYMRKTKLSVDHPTVKQGVGPVIILAGCAVLIYTLSTHKKSRK